MSKRWECPKCNRLYPFSLRHCPKCNSKSNNNDIIKNIKNNHERILSSSKKIRRRHKK